MLATKKQVDYICLALYSNDIKGEKNSIKKVESMEYGTAKDIIGLFEGGHIKPALSYLTHLEII